MMICRLGVLVISIVLISACSPQDEEIDKLHEEVSSLREEIADVSADESIDAMISKNFEDGWNESHQNTNDLPSPVPSLSYYRPYGTNLAERVEMDSIKREIESLKREASNEKMIRDMKIREEQRKAQKEAERRALDHSLGWDHP